MSTQPAGPKLLLLAGGLDAARGGQERSVVETVRHLQAQGARVTVAAPGRPPADLGGAAFRPLAASPPRRARALGAMLDRSEDLARTLRGSHVVLAMLPVRAAHAWLPRGGLSAEAHARSAAARRTAAGRALARLGASLSPRRRLLRARERALMEDPRGPLLVALSDYVARQAVHDGGLPEARVRTVRNGVDLGPLTRDEGAARDMRRMLEIPREAVLFVALAHNHRLKGVPQLLAAVRRLPPEPPWRLVVAGGPVRRSGDRVCFLGPVDGTVPLVSAADVLVHPTFYDPSSRVVLEALALGVPVVTTRWNGAADFLEAGGGVVLEDPRDSGTLAGALQHLLDPAVRATLAEDAGRLRRAVSLERHTAELLAVLRELGAPPGAPAAAG